MTNKVPRVTLDTNVCNLVSDPIEYASLASPGTGKHLQELVATGRIRGFFSEASIFIECLSFPDKIAYLAVAGTPDPRPRPDPRRFAVFETLAQLCVQMLHAPLIGAERFIEGLPWANDDVYQIAERQNRFSNFIRPYPRHEPLRTLGNAKLKNQPHVPYNRTWPTKNGFKVEIRQKWAVALKREYDDRDEKDKKRFRAQVEPIISEWCDVLIVGSHVAYGNDFFCTTDQGKGVGRNSFLHHTKRLVLAGKGIKIISPEEAISMWQAES